MRWEYKIDEEKAEWVINHAGRVQKQDCHAGGKNRVQALRTIEISDSNRSSEAKRAREENRAEAEVVQNNHTRRKYQSTSRNIRSKIYQIIIIVCLGKKWICKISQREVSLNFRNWGSQGKIWEGVQWAKKWEIWEKQFELVLSTVLISDGGGNFPY